MASFVVFNPMETLYCYVCKKKHEDESYRWSEKKIGKKTIRWCHLGIDCAGCQKVHSIVACGGFTITSRGTFCRGVMSHPPATLKQKLSNLSTEEVLSGGLAGLPNQFKQNSEDYTPAVKEQQHREVLKALR